MVDRRVLLQYDGRVIWYLWLETNERLQAGKEDWRYGRLV